MRSRCALVGAADRTVSPSIAQAEKVPGHPHPVTAEKGPTLACFGLTPRRYQSGEADRTGAISRAGDASVRVALFEAAHVMMTRVVTWSQLKAWAVAVAKRRGAKRAKVALARKIGVILHRMWVDGAEFRFTDKSEAGNQVKTIA